MSLLNTVTVALVQMTSTADVQENLRKAVRLVEDAAKAGASFIALPENFGFLGDEGEVLLHKQDIEGGLFTQGLRDVARRYGVFVLAGSIPERSSSDLHIYNTSVLLGPSGETVALYRKMHLFDVALGEHTRFAESSSVMAGRDVAIADVHGWPVGLSICYDVRFPELYRALSQQGARILTVPAAFTLHTGKDHWEVLLRARAIENQCYVLAPGQFGQNGPKRVCWGKSMIIDPWGTLLAVAPERECFIMATLDADLQTRVRAELPCLTHRHATFGT